MNVSTILVPVDLSANSLKALEAANDLAAHYRAAVHVLYVGIDLRSYQPFWGNFPSPELYERFEAWERVEAGKRLDKTCAEKLAGCPAYFTHIVTGDPAAEILKAARQHQADMIVMSAHGMTHCRIAERPADPGDVAAQVVKAAGVPVHLVNPCV